MLVGINVVSATEFTVSPDNYNTYFDDNGNLINSEINNGDILDLSGDFNNKNFTINKPLTITSKNSNANINDGTIILENTSSGSSISNLHIYNTLWYGEGITLDGSSGNYIFNNTIECVEHGGVALVFLPGSNNNIIEDNILNTTVTSWDAFHETVVIFASNYNTIRNNIVYCADDNGIYASIYGRSNGLKSSYNNIINNTVICQIDNPSAWNYGIQIMGDNNVISNNTVENCYRGISTTGGENNIISGNILDNILGDYAIYSTRYSVVRDNIISNFNGIDAGIYVGFNTNVINNTIEAKDSARGLRIGGSESIITGNNISTEEGQTIYGLGSFSKITITSNTLTSDTGIIAQFKKQSSKKYPSDISLMSNIITSNSSIILDAGEARNPIVFIVNTYEGNGSVILPESANNNSDGSGFNDIIYNITPSNYDEFFDATGIIRPNSLNDGDTTYFIGDFSNKVITVNKRLNITGDNPTFINTTFKLLNSGVNIENLNIINDNTNTWGIFVSGANNITILNNKISVKDSETAYCIYVLDSVDTKIINNTLNSDGMFLTYNILAYEVNDLTIENNIIASNGTGELYGYDSRICIDGIREVPNIGRTYGILAVYGNNMNIADNTITVTSKMDKNDSTEIMNSLNGIGIYYDSNNNIISSNNVYIIGNDSYIYGINLIGGETGIISTTANYNQINNNHLDISGTYSVVGVNAGEDTYNTLIANNHLDLKSDTLAFGLRFDDSVSNTVDNNRIITKSDANYPILLVNSDGNKLLDNSIMANGSYSYGIAASDSNYNTINSNTINVVCNNNENTINLRHTNTINPGNTGIYFTGKSISNNITNNLIITNTLYGVNITNNTGIVYNNQIKSANYTGDDAVYPNTENVYNNTNIDEKSISLTLTPLVKIYGEDDKLQGHITDSLGNPIIGHHISLTLTRPSNGASKTYDIVSNYRGLFELSINLAPGSYSALARYDGTDKYDASTSNTASITIKPENSNKTDTILTVNKYTEVYNANKSFTGILTDTSNNPLAGQHLNIKLTRTSSGASKTYSVTTDYNGNFAMNINLAPGEYTGLCSYDGTSKYQSCEGFNTITIY